MRLGGRKRKVLLFAALAVLAWAGVAAWLLVDAGAELGAGREALDRARNGATPASLLEDDTTRELSTANDRFDQARSRLRNPLLSPLRVVPVVGRHIRAADKVVATADGATEVAEDGVGRLRALADRPLGSGPERIAALEDLATLMGDTRRALDQLDPGSSDALIAPLRDAIDKLDEERRDSRATLGHAEDATRALVEVLRGPTPYLLLGANNAEMRAGSGMFLSATTLRFDQGSIRLADLRPTQELVLPAGAVPVDGDLAANWPWLDPGRDFRNLGLSADFPQSARLAAAMWARVPGGEPVGGVIAVDVDALRLMLRAVGPVEVDGVEYTYDNIRGELLRDQYGRFGDDRDARRDRLGEVAGEVFALVEAGKWDLSDMATALSTAVQGRHLMVWASDPDDREAWSEVGADAHLTDRSVAVSLLNRGANKLDSYVETHLSMTARGVAGGATELTMRYRIDNGAPVDGPQYLLGPNIDGLEEGEYRGFLVVNLPAGASDVALEGITQTLAGDDGPTVVAGGEVTVQRGESAEVTITAVLPRDVDQVTLEASARIPRTQLDLAGEKPDVDRRRTIPLSSLGG